MVKRDAQDKKDWDEYWVKQKDGGGRRWYGLVSEFYRKIVFQRTLEHFFSKYFRKKGKILHAGCGTGEVDSSSKKIFEIHALDISPEALKIYKKFHGKKAKTILGSIFNIPAKAETFDGIYNLGVMEHFSQREIQKILKEFKRVLKKDGKIILLWPPEYGLTVAGFKILHFFLNDVLGNDIQLHPAEPNRLQSKRQAEKILKKAGFKLLKYYFGPRDLFTYAIVVAEKK